LQLLLVVCPGISKYFPATQLLHFALEPIPGVGEYLPALHFWQVATLAENMPATHTMQLVAPTSNPVFVMDPALQNMQALSAMEL
jgi:hypothetical protein